MKVNLKKLAQKGEKIYKQIFSKADLKKMKGYFAAIEVESGEYFVAKKPVDAIDNAERVHPNKKYHLVRIGYPAAAILK